jgi:methyltransferase (TIGR00027 family)
MRPDRPSVTAFIIARAVVTLGGDEYGRQRLPPGDIVKVQKDLLSAVYAIRRPYLYPNPESSSSATWFWWCYWLLWCNPCYAKLVRWFLNGSMWLWGGHQRRVIRVLETIGYRKTFMEDCVRQGVEFGGCQQVLIVGGGFDTLALRLSESFPHVHFWEVDHPATGELKRQALQTLDRPNFHLVPIDLTTTTLKPELLSEVYEYNSDAPTVIIVEGVLMYLTEEQVVDSLQQLADLVGPRSLLAFDFVEGDDDEDDDTKHTPSKSMWGPILTPIFLWMLQHVLHEPWLFGVAPKRFPKFVEKKLSKWKCCSESMNTRSAGVVYVTKLQKR